MRERPLFLEAQVFRCVAAHCGCACTVAVLGILPETAPGLGCGVDALGRQFGSVRPASLAAWRSCALRVALLRVVAVAAAVAGALLLGVLLQVWRLALACTPPRVRGSPRLWLVG